MSLLLAAWLLVAHAAEPFDVHLDTTEGPVVVRVHPDWAPEGAARFRALVDADFYDGVAFHRVLHKFVAQFGIPPDPAAAASWGPIADDPVVQSNTRGRLTFATSGPNRRGTQLFFNLADNSSLDSQGFAPIGEVVEGMKAVDKLFHRYGESPPVGRGPSQKQAKAEGDAYLEAFPKLDRIRTAVVAE